MANGLSRQDVIKAIRHLYANLEWAQLLFDWMAERKRNPSETTIERLTAIVGSDVTEATAYAKELQAAGCGEYIVGRRGNASRFVWKYTCSSLGLAAWGETETLVGTGEAELEDEDPAPAAPQIPLTLTIPQAKEALARTFGVTPDMIEIIVKG